METMMSTISSAPAAARGTAGHSASQPWSSGLSATLKRWWAAYTTRRAEQAAMTLLGSMSDRELKDMGLTRCDITGAVRGGLGRDRGFSRYY
jgi:uncharacterized protein YjiS (DUF1127 family)